MSVAEKKSRLKENLEWDALLIKMLRGERAPAAFAALLGVEEETVLRWESYREAFQVKPNAEQVRRLAELAKRERFLEDWELVGSMELVGDLEEGSRELAEVCRRSLERTAYQLNE